MGLCISYQEAERLFEVWPMLKQTKEGATTELKIIETMSIDELIYTLSVGNKVLDGLPHNRTASSSTERVALGYENIANKSLVEARDNIKKEIIILFLVDEKLKIAYGGLAPVQQTILQLFYWKKKTWSEILDELSKEQEYISRYQAQTKRTEALTQIAITSRISKQIYTDVMKILTMGQSEKEGGR